MILKPPKLYLDTNHLIYISMVRRGEKLPDGLSVDAYQYLDDCIKSWCGIVFNLQSPIEWLDGSATMEGAGKIAAVIDSARLKYLLESDQLIYTREILDECLRINPNLKIPKFPTLQPLQDKQTIPSSLGIIVKEVPGYFTKQELEKHGNPQFPVEIAIISASECPTKALNFRQQESKEFQKRDERFKRSMMRDINGMDEYFNNPEYYQLEWMKRVLKIDRILAVNPSIDIDDILKRVNIDNCPAFSLRRKVWENWMKHGDIPQENDYDDYIYLPVIPYVDIALIERQLCGHIIQADNKLKSKVFCKAVDVERALKKWGSTKNKSSCLHC